MLTVQQSDSYTHRMSDGLETTSIIALMLQPQWLLLTHTRANADTHHTHTEGKDSSLHTKKYNKNNTVVARSAT